MSPTFYITLYFLSPSPSCSMMNATYPFVPIFNFICAFLVLIPLPWQLQTWNSGVCMSIIWSAIGCINRGVSVTLWKDNVEDWAPIWCDICGILIYKLCILGVIWYFLYSYMIDSWRFCWDTRCVVRDHPSAVQDLKNTRCCNNKRRSKCVGV